MPLADFHHRSTAALSHILNVLDQSTLERRLRRYAVSIAFDQNAITSPEGRVSLFLINDLAARFYPGVRYDDLTGTHETRAMAIELAIAARAIHTKIDTSPPNEQVVGCLAVGRSAVAHEGPVVYVGSDAWLAKVGSSGPFGSGASSNPCGAAAAASIGVANMFRLVFADLLPTSSPDVFAEVDVLHSRIGSLSSVLPECGVDLGETHLVGLGAIGRAAAWTLSQVPGLHGRLVLVDHETIEHSNLQRYVFATQRDQRRSRLKVEAAAEMFTQPGLRVIQQPYRWGDYLRQRGDCVLQRVATALDTAVDRIAVQAALPRRVLNAWTQPGDLGTSRHDFIEGACLACLYLPNGEVPSLSQSIAHTIRLPEMEVRAVLEVDGPVTGELLERICMATGVERSDFRDLVGLPLRVFYQKAVCGTKLFPAAVGGDRGEMAVPMAFQSALAGVLLAVDILADAGDLRSGRIMPVTSIDLMKRVPSLLTQPSAKHPSGRCICQDPVYVRVYGEKYGRVPHAEGVSR